jgi:hypothetical protein
VVIENQLAPHIVLCQHSIPMNKKFIHLGCEVTIEGNRVAIRKPDGAKVEILTLSFIKDYDRAEEFVREYIDLNLSETLTTV